MNNQNNEINNNLNNETNSWFNTPINPQNNTNENVSTMSSVNDTVNQPKMTIEDLLKPQSEIDKTPIMQTNVEPQIQPVNPVPSAPINEVPVQQPMPNNVQPQMQPVNPVPSAPINEVPVQQPMPNNMQPQMPINPVPSTPINGVPVQQPMPNVPNNNGKKSNGKFILIAIIALIIIAGVVAAIFLLSDKEEETPKKGQNEYEETENNGGNKEEEKESIIPTVEINSVSYDKISVGAKADVKDNTICKIYKSTDNVNFKYLLSVNCSGVYYSDYDVKENTTYYYKAIVENETEYSEVVSVTTPANNNSNTGYSETIKFQGFEFKKVIGYEYTIQEETLRVSVVNIDIGIGVSPYDYELVKSPAMLQQLKTTFESNGYLVDNLQTRNIYGIEMTTYDMTYLGAKLLYVIVEAADGYTFQVAIANTSNTINYDSLYYVADIIKDVEYKG